MALAPTAKPAGFWIRGLAACIDTLIIIVPMIIVGMFLVPFMSMAGLSLLCMVVVLAYYTFFNAGKWQGTPGKRLTGIYIVRAEDGGPIDVNRSLLRYFLLFGIFALINFLSIFGQATVPDSALSDAGKRFRIVSAKPGSERTAAEKEELFGLTLAYAQDVEAYNKEHMGFLPMLAGLLNIAASVYALGLAITVATHPEKAGWHDRICNTRVIRGRPDSPNPLQPA